MMRGVASTRTAANISELIPVGSDGASAPELVHISGNRCHPVATIDLRRLSPWLEDFDARSAEQTIEMPAAQNIVYAAFRRLIEDAASEYGIDAKLLEDPPILQLILTKSPKISVMAHDGKATLSGFVHGLTSAVERAPVVARDDLAARYSADRAQSYVGSFSAGMPSHSPGPQRGKEKAEDRDSERSADLEDHRRRMSRQLVNELDFLVSVIERRAGASRTDEPAGLERALGNL